MAVIIEKKTSKTGRIRKSKAQAQKKSPTYTGFTENMFEIALISAQKRGYLFKI